MLVFFVGAAIFVVAGFCRYLVLDRIGRRLTAFPDAYAAMRSQSWPQKLQPMSAALSDFAGKRQDRHLGDAGLTRLTIIAFWLGWVCLAGWLVSAAGVFLAMQHNATS